MTGHPYTWNGVAWVPVPDPSAVAGSALLADTDLQTVTTLTAPAGPLHPGNSVSLSATVKAGATNVTAGTVTFERMNPGSSTWTTIIADSASPWTTSYTLPSTLGTYKFRARYGGSGSWVASTSAEKSVSNTAASTNKTWSGYATSTRSYNGDGDLRSDYGDSRCYHGYYSSTQGQQRSALWFSIPSEIKNSNVTKVTLRLTRIGSLGDSSVTISAGTHTDSTVRSTWGAITGKATGVDTFAGSAWSSADKTSTYTLSSAIHAKFEAGAKGILLGPSSSNYCAFHGVAGVSSSEKPYLTIEYTV